MKREFTPGALRALAAAAGWQLGEVFDGLRPVTILMGLLSEAECRAALILHKLGIDESAILRRWPALTQAGGVAEASPGSVPVLHPDAESILAAIDTYVDWGDWPPIISTEHLLLGLAAGDDAVAAWLHNMGLDFHRLREQILERYGTPPAVSQEPLNIPVGIFQGDGEADQSAEQPPETGVQSQPVTSPTQQSVTPPPGASGGAVSGLSKAAGLSWETLAPAVHDQTLPPTGAEGLRPGRELPFYRIVDASINRCLEGLRVVEDYARFVLDDPLLVRELKELRHAFVRVTAAFPMVQRLAARETQSDVGTEIKADDELQRLSPDSLIDANLSRVREAMRSVEEYAKLLAPSVAGEVERLRYRCYTLHRALRISAAAREQLAKARLYVLVDARPTAEELARLVESLVTAGVSVIQLREKHLLDRELLERAKVVRSITRGTRTLFIMNDRPDLALLSDADGVHVGQEELTVKDARSIAGAEKLVGVSTHHLGQARQAVLDGADYIGCGPTFPSDTKAFSAFPGLEYLRQVAHEIRLPAFAIGGINEENLDAVLATGMCRVAVSGAILQASDPALAARRLLARLSQASGEKSALR